MILTTDATETAKQRLLGLFWPHIGKQVNVYVHVADIAQPKDLQATGILESLQRSPLGIEAVITWSLLPSARLERMVGYLYADNHYLGTCRISGSHGIESMSPSSD